MKIGILTLPLHTNFGGILQAYALQTILERMGHRVYVITIKQRPFTFPWWKRPIVYVYRALQRFKGYKIDIFIDKKINHDMPIIETNTKKFIDKYIEQWFINDISDIKKDDFDAIVVGSDQIWRKSYFESTYYTKYANAFLDFAKDWDLLKVAYACSFGFDKWEYESEETEQIKRLLQNFNAVSVREESAVYICKNDLGIGAKHVLDPTLLLDQCDYLKLIEENEPSRKLEGEMMVYVLDESEDNRKKIEEIVFHKGLKPFYFNAKIDNSEASTLERIQYSVTDWLAGFLTAKLIVTDSFHACVFSIIFNKPFVILKNNIRGNTRLDSLLKLLDISGSENGSYRVLRSEDYENHMNLLRQKSISVISNALKR